MKALLLMLVLAAAIHSTLIYIPGIPVDQRSLFKAQIALNRWEKDLNNNYGKRTENPIRTKVKTDLVDFQLSKLSSQLAIYNNVVVGSGNGLAGSNNLIIGNGNNVLGSNNYIFTSDFNTITNPNAKPSGSLTHTLVSDSWIGELDKKEQIISNLHGVIYAKS